jgi:hypothetical protein
MEERKVIKAVRQVGKQERLPLEKLDLLLLPLHHCPLQGYRGHLVWRRQQLWHLGLVVYSLEEWLVT